MIVMPVTKAALLCLYKDPILDSFCFLNKISEVKPVRLDDDTERYSWSRIKTLNYAYSVG